MDEKAPSTEILLEQYQKAIELYQHEDDLNWSKLNHLLYVNSGLWAILGFILQANKGAVGMFTTDLLVTVVGSFGLLVSLIFEVALWFGGLYMYERKKAVIRIEKRLIELGGAHVVSVPEEKQSYLLQSPTMWILRLIPLLLAATWIGILVKFAS